MSDIHKSSDMVLTNHVESGPDQPVNSSGEFKIAVSFDRTGGVRPNWKQLVFNEQNAGTPMTVASRNSTPESALNVGMTRIRHTFDGPVVQRSFAVGYFETFNAPEPITSPLTDVSTNTSLQNKALTKVYKRIWELDHQFQGGVFFGEIVPTWKMLVRPFGALRSNIFGYYSALKKGRGRNPPNRWRKVLADTWLEWSFGWIPLLADVRDAAIALARIYKNIPRSRIHVEFTEDDVRERFNFGSGAVFDQMYLNRTYTRSQKSKVIYHGVLKHLQTETEGMSSFGNIISLSGFDPRSFIPTAWELIPWSFLVDYFTNAGDLLQAYMTDLSHIRWINRVDWSLTEYGRECSIDYQSTANVFGSDLLSYTGFGGSARSQLKTIQRWIDPPMNYPGFQFNLGISTKQFANITALLAGGQLLKPFYR